MTVAYEERGWSFGITPFFRPRGHLWALIVLLLLFVPPTAAQIEQPEQAPGAARVLPLNRFPDSRLTGTDAQGFYRMPTGIGDDYFDGTDSIMRIRSHMEVARALGVKYLRCAFSWNGIEHERGKYSWGFWDRLVTESERYGIKLIPYVAYTPEWAARSRIEFWRQPPRTPELFAAFMEKIVARYHGRILSWELWNEPDLSEYWKGSPEEFAELIRQGATAARRADPDIVVVLGGLSLGPSPFFVKLITKEHIAAYVDVIAQHAYPESWDPERAETIFFQWTSQMRKLIEESGSRVDFWLNEIGYPDYRYRATNASKYGKTDVFYEYEHTARYQGVFLFKSFVMALASNAASLTVWYRIDDFPRTERRLGDDLIHFHLGVLNERGQPKPDFRAFQFLNRMFSLPTRSVANAGASAQKAAAVVNVLERRDSTLIVVAWLRSSERSDIQKMTGVQRDQRAEIISIPLPCRRVPTIQYFDAFGNTVQTSARLRNTGKTISMTGIPLRGDNVFVALAQCIE